MSYEAISSTTPVARKDYECIWCGEVIPKGEKHVRNVGKFEGDLQDIRFHNECDTAAVKWFRTEDMGDGFDPYGFKRGTTEHK